MNKKGFMKTLEATVAIILLLTFLISISRTSTNETEVVPNSVELLQDSLLNSIQENKTLRDHTLNDKSSEIKKFLDETVPETMEYNFSLCQSIVSCPLPSLPEQQLVYADSRIISANESWTNPTLVNLYLWFRV